jgi:uncharacterized protein (DUF2336 family)
MFESAVQSPAEAMNAARMNAPTTDGFRQNGGQAEPGRRYNAEDFRALMARLSKGAAQPKRTRSSTTLIHLPDVFAWCRPLARAEAEREAEQEVEAEDAADTESGAIAESADEGAEELAADPVDREAGEHDADDLQPPEGEPDSGWIAEPLPQDDPLAAEEEVAADVADAGQTADATGMADVDFGPAADEAASGIVEEEPQKDVAFAIEADAEGEVETVGQAPDPTAADSVVDPELQSAETARTLLDIMAMPTGVQPQERALAGDTLLRLVSRMPVASLVALCDRLCIMDAPPPLLVRRLINHGNAAVAGPLLERCPGISDQDLMSIVGKGDVATLRLIARRRHLSPALTDALIRHGDASVTIAVVRNPGAALSHEAFNMLAETAKTRTSLQAPLATRADTPAPIAFELFWILPPQLRRYVLSRFLTESANLDRILKIAQTLDESNGEGIGNSRIADKAECEELVGLIAQGNTAEAARKLASLAGISVANAERIITDSEGEPLTVAMKAMGMSRTQSAAAAETLRDAPEAPLRSNRRIAELQNLFDSLSFTKARVLLTYWDWAVEQSGPYSGKAV